ncbi:MAG TPA: NlpC/P60 family protein, partial [Allosphingosinicella sp.]|nr:NlpC/P60 family protein [Allosphingosinicella sp.]
MTVSNAISSRTAPPESRRGNAASSFSTGERFELTGSSGTLDPRTHAYRADIADIALAGRIIAPHYARPLVRACGPHTISLRDRPRSEGDAASELLPGEEFAVLEYSGGWAWGYGVADHRVGYVEAIELIVPVEPTHIVCEASAPIHPDDDIHSPILCRLPMGARLHGIERGPCLATEIGCVPLCHLRRIGEFEVDPVAVAERLLRAPYRPGGRSFRGIDCAGLAQLAYGLCGLPLPRECEQQQALGEEVPEGDRLQRGDLVFSG